MCPTEYITKAQDKFDLNEISYLSLFCDTIIGRASGPYVFTQVKENLYNPNKTFLAFTRFKNVTSLVLDLDIPAKRFWSPETEEDKVFEEIVKVIEQ